MITQEPRIPTFASESRIHFGVPVRDLERSAAFYRTLFGVDPTKVRPGYIRFEVSDPAVHLGLTESDTEGPDSISHYGIQVKSQQAIERIAKRLEASGWTPSWERSVVCCHATQEKIWVHDPDGRAWEVYLVVDDAPETPASSGAACCQTESCGTAASEELEDG